MLQEGADDELGKIDRVVVVGRPPVDNISKISEISLGLGPW